MEAAPEAGTDAAASQTAADRVTQDEHKHIFEEQLALGLASRNGTNTVLLTDHDVSAIRNILMNWETKTPKE
eukprot:625410-Pleurochrysis_carterae.AAC.1